MPDLAPLPRTPDALEAQFAVLDAARLFESPEDWPLRSALPVKREASDGFLETGALLRQEHGGVMPVVFAEDGAHGYETFEDVARDGWRAD